MKKICKHRNCNEIAKYTTHEGIALCDEHILKSIVISEGKDLLGHCLDKRGDYSPDCKYCVTYTHFKLHPAKEPYHIRIAYYREDINYSLSSITPKMKNENKLNFNQMYSIDFLVSKTERFKILGYR